MRIITSTNRRAVAALLDRRTRRDGALARRVGRIIEAVRSRGDAALLEYARRLDGLQGSIEVSAAELAEAGRQVAPPVRRAIAAAARSIRRVAASQLPRSRVIETTPGVRVHQRVSPLDRVGCYVPGGRYPLPSSLLMTAIPAKVAGVKEIIAVCPRPDATVMCAAAEAGVTRLLRLGGAHAVAALAYGTPAVPRVDKIVGPGNAYVATAKALVASDCAIDFFAGPSEIAVVSANGNPAWIAADLLAQAEHDPEARAILITPRASLAAAVRGELRRQMPARGPARDALARNGGAIVTRSLDEAIELAQRMAPEHVVCDAAAVAARLTRAGTVFVGRHSAQAAGDYATGSNHVLPTSGAARARGGLSTADFVRVTSVQTLTRAGLVRIAPHAIALANAEGLSAHAASIAIRLQRQREGAERGTGAPRATEPGGVQRTPPFTP
jgi:histidinol dehydrogenase